MTKLQKKLKAMTESYETTSLVKYVAQDLLEAGSDEEIKNYTRDILQHGCQSGIVSGLIYYHDTKNFYIRYMDDIEELYEETTNNIGEQMQIGTPMYNWFAWFGFEETVHRLADELNISY